MMTFEFEYGQKKVLSVNNISDLFRKDIWNKFEEAVTQHLKPLIIHDLEPLRDELENAQTTITCRFNQATESFDFAYATHPDVADKLAAHLKKIGNL